MHRKVEFKGEIYWHSNNNISPLDHYDEDGNLLADPFHDISYAVVVGDDIMRYGQVIGKVTDLIEVK